MYLLFMELKINFDCENTWRENITSNHIISLVNYLHMDFPGFSHLTPSATPEQSNLISHLTGHPFFGSK